MKNQGLTLVELLIAITLAMFLFGGCVGFLFHIKQRLIVHQGAAIIQENARFLSSYFENIVQYSGFLGCQRINQKAIVYLHPPLTEPDVGWDTRQPVKKVRLQDLAKNRFIPKTLWQRAIPEGDILWVNTIKNPRSFQAVEVGAGKSARPIITFYDCSQNDILILQSEPIDVHKLSKHYAHQAFVAEFVSSLYYVGKTKRENVLALYRTDLMGRTQEIVEGVDDFKINLAEKTVQLSVLLSDPNKQVQSRWFHYVYLL